MSVFVGRLSVYCTAEELRLLFERNGLVPGPLHIRFVSDQATYKCAICLFVTPDLCRRAISVRELVGSSVPSPIIQEHTKPDYYLSLLQCEMLLDHHFPLQWSSRADFKPLPVREGAKFKALISVSVYWNRDAQEEHGAAKEPILVVFHTSQFEQQCDVDDAVGLLGEIKRHIALTKCQAMSKVEVLILGGPKAMMRRVKTAPLEL